MLNSQLGMEEMERVALLYAVCVSVCVCVCVCVVCAGGGCCDGQLLHQQFVTVYHQIVLHCTNMHWFVYPLTDLLIRKFNTQATHLLSYEVFIYIMKEFCNLRRVVTEIV